MSSGSTIAETVLLDHVRRVWEDFREGAQTTGRHLAMEKSLASSLQELGPVRTVISVDVTPTASEREAGPSVLVRVEYVAEDDGALKNLHAHLEDF